eukprot:5362896-Prymnesium_polylepis.1
MAFWSDFEVMLPKLGNNFRKAALLVKTLFPLNVWMLWAEVLTQLHKKMSRGHKYSPPDAWQAASVAPKAKGRQRPPSSSTRTSLTRANGLMPHKSLYATHTDILTCAHRAAPEPRPLLRPPLSPRLDPRSCLCLVCSTRS